MIKRKELESVAVRWVNLEPLTQTKKVREKQVSYVNGYIRNLGGKDSADGPSREQTCGHSREGEGGLS